MGCSNTASQEEIISNNSAANQPEDEKKFKDFDKKRKLYSDKNFSIDV